MGKTAHTPGPWFVGPVDDTLVSHTDPARGKVDIAHAIGDYSDPAVWPTMEANARLIAAAPDLLAALTTIMREYRGVMGDLTPEIADAYAAIAKAEGR